MVTSAAAPWEDGFVHEACSAWAGTDSDQRLSQVLDEATICPLCHQVIPVWSPAPTGPVAVASRTHSSPVPFVSGWVLTSIPLLHSFSEYL